MQSQKTAPKWIEKREADRLIRMAEKDGSKRNLPILQLLRHTGLRVAELCALRLGDVESSERKGKLTVRSGKGSNQRVIPLNFDASLASYLSRSSDFQKRKKVDAFASYCKIFPDL